MVTATRATVLATQTMLSPGRSWAGKKVSPPHSKPGRVVSPRGLGPVPAGGHPILITSRRPHLPPNTIMLVQERLLFWTPDLTLGSPEGQSRRPWAQSVCQSRLGVFLSGLDASWSRTWGLQVGVGQRVSGRARTLGPRLAEQRPLASRDNSEALSPALAPDAEDNTAQCSLSSAGREPWWQHIMA